jgi:hypothetical protein
MAEVRVVQVELKSESRFCAEEAEFGVTARSRLIRLCCKQRGETASEMAAPTELRNSACTSRPPWRLQLECEWKHREQGRTGIETA